MKRKTVAAIFKKSFVSPISRDKFFIKIDDELNWKILPETIVITNLNCQKAEVEYGGRQWIAWFTSEIPISDGPYKFRGLPGLIIEVFDDKKTGETSSNVFSGDVVRSKHQIISLRADHLEGQKIPIPITKTFLMTEQKKILYLIDVNSKERWIEESSINKK